MVSPEEIDEVRPHNVFLTEGILGYNIVACGEVVGYIEGIPGSLEHIEVELHWRGKGIARAALQEFILLSREAGHSKVTTTNTLHPAMDHLLETEGFEEQTDDIGWEKDLS